MQKKLKQRKRPRFSYSINEIKNIHQETLKVAKVTVPSKGYDSGIAETNSMGFVKWLKYAHEWSQIGDNQFEKFLEMFNEAHTKVLSSEGGRKAQIFYSELSTLSALGISKALSKIKLLFVKIIGA